MSGPRYAGFWRRTGAAALDSLLLLALLLPLLYAVYGPGYFHWLASSDELFSVYGALDLALTYLLPFALAVWLWLRYGATPGKLLLECRIVDAESLGPISPRQAVLRYLGYILSMLPFYLGFLWIAWDKRKQGFHDKVAGTVVLYAPADESDKSLAQLMEESS